MCSHVVDVVMNHRELAIRAFGDPLFLTAEFRLDPKMKKLTLLMASMCLALALSGTARADAITLTFDELPNQPVHGLVFMGVTFSFSMNGMPSPDARFNAIGPGDGAYIQGSVLEG